MLLNLQAKRYALIGVLNTVTYLLIVWLLTKFVVFSQLYANIAANILVSSLSFWMNARWSFQKKPGVISYARFQLVAVLGLIASAFLGHLGDLFDWHFLITVFLIGLTIPAISFLLHRSFSFSK
jgi:putative flippase GtrA